jgi:hypothetical protein
MFSDGHSGKFEAMDCSGSDGRACPKCVMGIKIEGLKTRARPRYGIFYLFFSPAASACRALQVVASTLQPTSPPWW